MLPTSHTLHLVVCVCPSQFDGARVWIFISMSVLSVALPSSLILHAATLSSLSFRILVTRRFIFSVWPAVSLWSQALAHFGSQLVSFHCIMSSSVPHVFSPAVSHDRFGPFRLLRLHSASAPAMVSLFFPSAGIPVRSASRFLFWFICRLSLLWCIIA